VSAWRGAGKAAKYEARELLPGHVSTTYESAEPSPPKTVWPKAPGAAPYCSAERFAPSASECHCATSVSASGCSVRCTCCGAVAENGAAAAAAAVAAATATATIRRIFHLSTRHLKVWTSEHRRCEFCSSDT
jgi:septal ring-binding cell division protein DamX